MRRTEWTSSLTSLNTGNITVGRSSLQSLSCFSRREFTSFSTHMLKIFSKKAIDFAFKTNNRLFQQF
jgi:hypothetical protein